ncbi:MAG: hypothetical protein Tsb0013_16260 [Phycisphaerales bacterium]
MHRAIAPLALISLAGTLHAGAGSQPLHITYLWHMEQPIYWPDQQSTGADRYERAWQSISSKNGGRFNPTNDLNEIFGKPDRVAAYQYRTKDAITDIDYLPEAGAQVSFSGGLIENIQSFIEAGGAASYLGYQSNWNSHLSSARTWPTSFNGPARADVVNFAFHHPLLPLVSDSTARKELELYQHVYSSVWGPGASRGLFPSEMAFSTRLIPVLDDLGIEWTFVSAEKISRACPDFPVVFGQGGINCDPPNRADQINPDGVNYFRKQIDRGCSPAEAFPFSYIPSRAKYVDPETGAVSSVILIPCAQHLGWDDGYSPQGTGNFDTIAAGAQPGDRPMLITLAHDGDNAWGGGNSYYREAVKNFANAATSSGHVMTVVERYLQDHPVPTNEYIHIEDGAWVNADGDFGAPQFLNWNWPPVNAQGEVDIENGWAEDIRNWAVITAAQNHVDTAEQIATDSGLPVRIDHVLNPRSDTRPAERAWHYFLGGLNSGYMYYGTAEDFEVKPTIASNEALEHTAPVIGDAAQDATGPEVWIPQRFPWNPGDVNFGPHLGYQQVKNNGDFYVWTFVHDVSGTTSVELKYRVDNDGTNPLSSNQNETFAGGAEVGAWQTLPMTARAFPATNVFNDPNIDFFEMPQEIADQYFVRVNDLRSVLIDYYVEATDSKGNVTRSPIQHVWIGDGVNGVEPVPGSGTGGPGGSSSVTFSPDAGVATAGDDITITYDPAGGPLAGAAQVFLYRGYDGWSTVVSPDAPMSYDAIEGTWSVTVSTPSHISELNLVFNNGAGTWDNNNGQDWGLALLDGGGTPPLQWQMDGNLDPEAVQAVNAPGRQLYAGLSGDILYIATQPPADHDVFMYVAGTPGPFQPANWAKGGNIAAWDAFVGAESTNSFAGWFDDNGASTGLARGTWLEATVNLRALLGLGAQDDLPATVWIAGAAFQTDDGGSLLTTLQAPPSLDFDFNIDADEYAEIVLCDITPGGCPVVNDCTADFDNDGDVDLGDFGIFGGAFGSVAGDANYDPGADFDNDGDVDLGDFGIFGGEFGRGDCLG